MVNENYWETDTEEDEVFEEAEAYESPVEEEVDVDVVEEDTAPVDDEETVRLEVVYSKLNYKGTVYQVGDILELSPEDADFLLEAMSGRPHRHLEFAD